MSPPSAAIIPSAAVHLLPKPSYSPPLTQTHHCSSPEPNHPISRRNFAILLSSIVTLPLPSLLQPPPPAYAVSFGISGPKEWLREQKKKSAKFLLAPVDASRNILQSAFLLLVKSESEFGGNNWEDVQKLLISAARDCVPQDRNSFVEFQSNTGVEVCTFQLIVKNAASLLDDKDPIKLEAEAKLSDLIRSFAVLNGMVRETNMPVSSSSRQSVADALKDTISSLNDFEQGIKNCLEV
ncbi:Twin-arginine translocation pathway [Forsythia ovata]|uniref:Twin-arginine translocation pathway n=1 Tax=Forsythia ovata TaxID=205694 RepID=A0ABD1VM87_9LAMI